MLKAFEDDDYDALVEKMMEIETDTAPKPNVSRILHRDNDEIKIQILMLLSHLEHKDLRSILDNTLPSQWRKGTSSRMTEPHPGRIGNALDPVVYVNYIVDKNDHPLDIPRLPVLLDALETAVGITSSTTIGKKAYSTTDLERRLNDAYGKGLNVNFFTHGSKIKMNELRNQVKDFVKYYRDTVLPAATSKGYHFIQFPGEVGISNEGSGRCEAHASLDTSSPHLFRLVQLVLRILWHAEGWHLRQIFLFQLQTAQQADVGETIGSIMCSAYNSTGGFNFEQPGISQTGIAAIKANEWKDIVSNGERRMRPLWTSCQKNIDAWEALVRGRLAKEETKHGYLAARLNSTKEKERHGREAALLGAELDRMNSGITKVNEALDRVKLLEDRLSEQDADIQALLDFGDQVEEIGSEVEQYLARLSSRGPE